VFSDQGLVMDKEAIIEEKDIMVEKLGASSSSVLSLLRDSRRKYKCEECEEIFDRASRLKNHPYGSGFSDVGVRTEGSQKGDSDIAKAIEELVIANDNSPLGNSAMSSVSLDKGKEGVREAREVIECEGKAGKRQTLYVKELKV